jgi:hypothetical protein
VNDIQIRTLVGEVWTKLRCLSGSEAEGRLQFQLQGYHQLGDVLVTEGYHCIEPKPEFA